MYMCIFLVARRLHKLLESTCGEWEEAARRAVNRLLMTGVAELLNGPETSRTETSRHQREHAHVRHVHARWWVGTGVGKQSGG